MATSAPAPIPFPLSTFPGANPQEGSGRLLNCYAEPLGEADRPTGPAKQVWRRSPGISRFAKTTNVNHRGGLLVNNAAFEVFNGAVVSVDPSGNVTTLTGTVAGTSKVSMARNNVANLIIVDPGNGAFQVSAGVVTAYNASGVLPQPDSVCFQDGYLFFTIADGRCFATATNSLTMNALTFITANAKADVTLLRGIAFSGVLWLFSTGHCEIWQDTAQPFPGFPYSRLIVLEFGLIQSGAIAGFEVGFSELLWVAQNFGVYWSSPGGYSGGSPQKVSPPDLEKLIEAQIVKGNTLDAWCYMFAGKKVWVLNSPDWTWEFNLTSGKWAERSSLLTGIQAQYRASNGHPAFSKWLVGDRQSGDIDFIDDTNFDERGQPQLFRVESGPVKDFPNQIRIARADFDFTAGTGRAVGSETQNVLAVSIGAANPAGGNFVRFKVMDTARMKTGDTVNVTGITNVLVGPTGPGSAFVNQAYLITVIDDQNIDLQATQFQSQTYTSGGKVVDVTLPANAQNPSVAISCSKDGAITWGNPLVRSLGVQQRTKFVRASVKNLGQSGPMGDRWRVDVTDPVYTALQGGTQSSNPKEVGA